VLSVTAGNHRLRFGGEYRFSQVKFYFNAFSRGQIIYSSFNISSPGRARRSSVRAFSTLLQGHGHELFAQDDWKINNRLTVNLGLRYDLYGLPVENEGRLVNLLFNQIRIGTAASPAGAPNGFVQAEGGSLSGVPTVEKTLVPVDKNNFAPRIGFAYQLSEKLNMVLRGGYGIYYDRISTRYANTQLFNYPYFALGVGLPGFCERPPIRLSRCPRRRSFPVVPNIPSPLSPLSPLVGVPIAGVYVDPELRTPYIQQYNFGLQWEFWNNFVWDIGYVGNKGTRLLQVISPNQPVYNQTTNSFATPFSRQRDFKPEKRNRRRAANSDDFPFELQFAANLPDQTVFERLAVSGGVHVRQIDRLLFGFGGQRAGERAGRPVQLARQPRSVGL
jgi:outer membrane receptor protein involved in Fe transport